MIAFPCIIVWKQTYGGFYNIDMDLSRICCDELRENIYDGNGKGFITIGEFDNYYHTNKKEPTCIQIMKTECIEGEHDTSGITINFCPFCGIKLKLVKEGSAMN